MAKLAKSVIPVKQMILEMMIRECSRQHLTKITGLTEVTICRYLEVLRQRPGNLVYLSGHRRNLITSGDYTELFSWGPGKEDVLKPAKLTYKERKYRRNVRKSIVKTEKGIQHVCG